MPKCSSEQNVALRSPISAQKWKVLQIPCSMGSIILPCRTSVTSGHRYSNFKEKAHLQPFFLLLPSLSLVLGRPPELLLGLLCCCRGSVNLKLSSSGPQLRIRNRHQSPDQPFALHTDKLRTAIGLACPQQNAALDCIQSLAKWHATREFAGFNAPALPGLLAQVVVIPGRC